MTRYKRGTKTIVITVEIELSYKPSRQEMKFIQEQYEQLAKTLALELNRTRPEFITPEQNYGVKR